MHVFGSVCYAHVQNTTKLDPRAEKGIFVGYDRSSPAFLVYCPQAKTVRKVRCVKFTENVDNVDETVELLPDSVKPGEPEIPTHGMRMLMLGVTLLEIMLGQNILMTI